MSSKIFWELGSRDPPLFPRLVRAKGEVEFGKILFYWSVVYIWFSIPPCLSESSSYTIFTMSLSLTIEYKVRDKNTDNRAPGCCSQAAGTHSIISIHVLIDFMAISQLLLNQFGPNISGSFQGPSLPDTVLQGDICPIPVLDPLFWGQEKFCCIQTF